MTLYEIINILEKISLQHPYIRTSAEGSIYDFMNANPSIKYGVFFASQTTHRETDEMDYYGFNLFVVDRLNDTMESNRLQIQSASKVILSNIIHTICNNFDIDYESIRYTPFTQKFVDECAGMYATVVFEVPKNYVCPEVFGPKITPTN